MYTAEQKARIKWACRRGMLELDVVIMPFFEECFDSLTESSRTTLWLYWKVTTLICLLG
ncbi:FAD assembly factor SdhE [Vibrio cholerae]|nr:FAD assembly factor SdhE [Vibrio cholerae]